MAPSVQADLELAAVSLMANEPTNVCIFIVIAAYNEARAIRGVVDGLKARYSNVVVVDDGSTDGTSAALADSGVFLLRHMVNRGQGAALQTGIQFAVRQGAEVVVTFDADGQHDTEDIPALVAPVLSGECDVALGSRFLHPGTEVPQIRRLVLKSGVLFTRVVSRVRISDTHNGFRAFSRKAASALRITLDRMAHASEIIDQIRENRWRYREVPVRILYTDYAMNKGQSSWNALRIAWQFLFRKLTR